MKDASYLIRKEVYDALSGNITLNSSNVPVYNVVPSTQNGYPYILITSVTNTIADNMKESYLNQIVTQVEIVTGFDTNTGGQLDANLGINQIAQLLISRNTFFNLSSSNFKVISAENNGINYITEDTKTKTFYRGILTYSNLVEQL